MLTYSSPEATTAFADLARIVYSGASYDDVHDAVCRLAVATVDGCDHASIMLRKGGKFWTSASSDVVAAMADAFERELGEGPCVDAIEVETADLTPDLTKNPRWPRFSLRLLQETPIRGMAGFRIQLDGRKVGALNIFSDTPGKLTDASVNQCAILSAFISVALTAVERGSQMGNLRHGLDTNREIGKAVGLLMAIHGVSDEEAFDMLAKTSQDMNIKLAQVAHSVLEDVRTPRP